jgi:phage N-6-adenine-methyltransferase
MFSSKTDEWATPQDLFDRLNAEFGFVLDVCATPENAKCARYYTREVDGLKQDWARDTRGGFFWMNPPYGDPEHPCKRNCKKRRCKTCEQDPTPACKRGRCSHRGHHINVYIPGVCDWVAKAAADSLRTAGGVCLLPARTDTRWFQTYCIPVLRGERRGAVEFLPGRLKFGGAANSAPFPSVVVVFRPAISSGEKVAQ